MSMNERVQKRLRGQIQMVQVNFRAPEDLIEDLKILAPQLGFQSYQALMKVYISRGVRKDLEALQAMPLVKLKAALKRHGMNDEDIVEVIEETGLQPA